MLKLASKSKKFAAFLGEEKNSYSKTQNFLNNSEGFFANFVNFVDSQTGHVL